MINVIDRVPTRANRKKITFDDNTVRYATVEYADEPLQAGTPINRALFQKVSQIVQGSYVGTGVFGAGNQNTLTFDFEPKILIIGGKYTAGVTEFYIQAILVNGVPQSSALTVGYVNNTTYSGAVSITWSGQTVSWQGESALKQLNYAGGVYQYIAIG